MSIAVVVPLSVSVPRFVQFTPFIEPSMDTDALTAPVPVRTPCTVFTLDSVPSMPTRGPRIPLPVDVTDDNSALGIMVYPFRKNGYPYVHSLHPRLFGYCTLHIARTQDDLMTDSGWLGGANKPPDGRSHFG